MERYEENKAFTSPTKPEKGNETSVSGNYHIGELKLSRTTMYRTIYEMKFISLLYFSEMSQNKACKNGCN